LVLVNPAPAPAATSQPEVRRDLGDFWPSLTALAVANLWPLAGVVFLHWTVFSVVLLFWLENVIVGVFNLARMWMAQGGSSNPGGKAFFMPFFTVHYGMFTLVHGIFVLALFGGAMGEGGLGTLGRSIEEARVGAAALALAASHGVSFVFNYLGSGEFRTTTLDTLMVQPYGRVVVLHLMILFGGFLIMALGSPMIPLALLVILKIGLDVTAHVKEHTGAGGLLLLRRRP
jgi:hypothetical protein